MISCCEIALALALANIVSLAVFAGYTVKLRTRQFELEKRNGKELREIHSIRSFLSLKEQEILELKAKVTELELQNERQNKSNNSSQSEVY